jgi:2-polyprenyl-3-methyl-5-hydroxy-6-metoxy-1,4-benzoquinol methylase
MNEKAGLKIFIRRSIKFPIMFAPKEISILYKDSSLLDRLYVQLRWFTNHFEFIETLIPKKGKILDVGCGYGLCTNYIALKAPDRVVMGVDFSRKRVSIATKTSKYVKNVKYLLNDVNDLKQGKFDIILMTDFLHHISPAEQDKAIAYASKNLKRGGKLIIKDLFKESSLTYFTYYFIDRFILNFGGKVYYFSEESIMDRLKMAGFETKTVNTWKKAFAFEMILLCKRV